MSDIKLFELKSNEVTELQGKSVELEKSLQTTIEQNLETFLGVRFLATEHSTGKTHGGRIDTLGIDENGCPVIIEYKRALNQNVINQGLFYLDWLLDHKAEFKLLVMEKINKETAEDIEWRFPRLLCIAGDFNKYDSHAIQQMNRNIELIKYRLFGQSLLLFELINATSGYDSTETTEPTSSSPTPKTKTEVTEYSDISMNDLYEKLKEFLFALGDDVQIIYRKSYVAFKRIKTIAYILMQKTKILIYVKVNLETTRAEEGFTRPLTSKDHWGTGNFEIRLSKPEDLEKAKPLLIQSYENN